MTTDTRPPLVITEQIDNPRTCVNHLLFPAGGESRWHRHERDYVIVPVQDCELQIDTGDGPKPVKLKTGDCYYRDAGVEHNVMNDSDVDIVLIEVELK
ncbi:MAG: cupin domain-containing protein [Marinobacterium sp.]|nr:cupin domain-containing protein [Marinobacterium sp.]